MRNQFVASVIRAMRRDESIVLLLGDIGVFGFRHAMMEFPDRVYNIGILEQATVGVAAGLSARGFHPIIHTIAPFMVERALEQIKIDLGFQKLDCTLVSVGASFDYASLGATHHCPADVGLMLSVPGMNVFVPGSDEELDNLLSEQFERKELCYVRLSESSNRIEHEPLHGGGIDVLRLGPDATVLAIGPILDLALEATAGLDVTVLYANQLRPVDDFLLRLDTENPLVIIEPFYEGTTIQCLPNALMKRRVMSIGIPRQFIYDYGTFAELMEFCGLEVRAVRSRIQEMLSV